jgi:hypothetical protein
MLWLLLAPWFLFSAQAAQQPARPKLEAPAPQESDIMPPGPAQVLTVMSFEGSEFIRAFNATADRPRIVLVLSPT